MGMEPTLRAVQAYHDLSTGKVRASKPGLLGGPLPSKWRPVLGYQIGYYDAVPYQEEDGTVRASPYFLPVSPEVFTDLESAADALRGWIVYSGWADAILDAME